jgi:AcrR family transcriptional regulator
MSPQHDDEVDHVLDAAAECYLRLGATKTTATDIAVAAGISRATLYRRFGSHEALFRAVIERESETMTLQTRAHLAGIDDPAEWLLESMMFSIEQITSRPLHAALFTTDSAAWAARRTIRMQEIRRISERGLRQLMKGAIGRGDLTDEDVSDLADWIMRILMSYASVPGAADREPSAIRRQLTTWFLPAVRPYLEANAPRMG